MNRDFVTASKFRGGYSFTTPDMTRGILAIDSSIKLHAGPAASTTYVVDISGFSAAQVV